MRTLPLLFAMTLGLTACSLELDMETLSDTQLSDLEDSCEQDDPQSCVQLGNEYEEAHDYFSAAKYYVKACNSRDREGCRGAAKLYWEGNGNLKQSHSLSKKYAEKGCQLGDMVCCNLETAVNTVNKQKETLKNMREQARTAKHKK